MPHSPQDKTFALGLWLLAISVPLGLTLQALHALKVQVYFESSLRRALWTVAHAHGSLLGILCLALAQGSPRLQARARASVLRGVRAASVLTPLGFSLGGVLDHGGDPSYGIALAPIGGVVLLLASVRALLAKQPSDVAP